jgi:hypothetical protein
MSQYAYGCHGGSHPEQEEEEEIFVLSPGPEAYDPQEMRGYPASYHHPAAASYHRGRDPHVSMDHSQHSLPHEAAEFYGHLSPKQQHEVKKIAKDGQVAWEHLSSCEKHKLMELQHYKQQFYAGLNPEQRHQFEVLMYKKKAFYAGLNSGEQDRAYKLKREMGDFARSLSPKERLHLQYLEHKMLASSRGGGVPSHHHGRFF